MRYRVPHQIVLREAAFVVLLPIAILLLTIITSCGYGHTAPSPSPASNGADSLKQIVRYYITYEVSF